MADKHLYTRQVDPFAVLALATLRQAKADASRGDTIAALWLAGYGREWANCITSNGSAMVDSWLTHQNC